MIPGNETNHIILMIENNSVIPLGVHVIIPQLSECKNYITRNEIYLLDKTIVDRLVFLSMSLCAYWSRGESMIRKRRAIMAKKIILGRSAWWAGMTLLSFLAVMTPCHGQTSNKVDLRENWLLQSSSKVGA